MEIANPKRVLAVSLESEAHHLSRVIQDLTGKAPEPQSTSLAGTTQDLELKTAYYSTSLPIWLDLVASSPEQWSSAFLSDDAKEVLAVLGGLILVFGTPKAADVQATTDLIKHVGRLVKDGLGGWAWDGVGLAVSVGEGDTEELDELCAEVGLELVQVTGKDQGRNEFGEKMGIARVTEALESNDWAQLDAEALSDFGDFQGGSEANDDQELDPESLDFGFDRADFEGMRQSIWATGRNPDGESEAEGEPKAVLPGDQQRPQGDSAGVVEDDVSTDDVAQVERMMQKLQAVKEMGEGMPVDQRRRMAAKAVQEVMKELS